MTHRDDGRRTDRPADEIVDIPMNGGRREPAPEGIEQVEPSAGPAGAPTPDPAADGASGLPSPRGSARTLLSGTSWQTLSQLVPLAINLGLTPVFIHGLLPGRYSVFLLISSMTVLLSQFDGGISQSTLRYFTLYAGKDDRRTTTSHLATVTGMIVAASLVVTAIVFAATDPILRYFAVAPDLFDEAAFLLRLLTLIIGLILARNIFTQVITARHLFRYPAMGQIAGYAVYITGLLLTISQGWGLYGVGWTMLLQQAVASLFTLPLAVRYLDRAGLRPLDRAAIREFFGYAWKVQVSGIVGQLALQKDQLVAGRVLSAQESGPFGQGSNFAGQLKWMPMNAIGPIQAMIGSEVGARGAPGAAARVERLQRLWVRATSGWFAVGAPAAYFGVQAWLPPAFDTAGPVAAILLVGGFFVIPMQVLVIWTLTLGHPELQMRYGIVTLVATLVLSVALGVPLGMLGVVAATSAGQAVSMAFFVWDTRRTLSTPIRWFILDTPWLAVVVAAGVTTLVEWLAYPFMPDHAPGLLLCGLLGLPGLALYLPLAFDRDERRGALARLRRRSA